MNPKERRNYEFEYRRQERLKQDLEAEVMLKEQMDFTKKLVGSA